MPDYLTLLNPTATIGLDRLEPLAVHAGLAGGPRLLVSLRRITQGERFVVVQAEVRNPHAQAITLSRLRWTSPLEECRPPLVLHGTPARLTATETYRGDYFALGSTMTGSYASDLDNLNVEVGQSEDQGFPGVHLSAPGKSLLIAQLSQARFHLLFRIRGGDGKGRWQAELDEVPSGLDGVTVPPGATLRGEELLVAIADDPQPRALATLYHELLTARGHFARLAANPLPAQRIWCTWNYDFYADVTQERVLAQLPILRQTLPAVRFIQIDDGYQELIGGQRAMIDFVYGGAEGWDRTRFPDGPAGVVRAIKAAGFRPALWLGLWGLLSSRMLTEHPEWVLRDDCGRPMHFTQWYGGVAVLDPSVPGVRTYIEGVCRKVFGDWGFEGVKLDFSTFAFEGKRVRFREPSWTALQCRTWLVDTFRRHLPPDGFFGWCVVAGTGNPLNGGGADYFRAAEDINNGDWPTVRRVAGWIANTAQLVHAWPVLPNIDSIGRKDGASTDTEWRTWLNLAAVSGMALEVSGDLRLRPVAELQRLQRCLELSEPTARLSHPDLGRDSTTPSLWLSRRQGRTLLGVFNWSDRETAIPIPAELQGGCHDAWDGQSQPLGATLALSPHASALVELP